MFDKREEKGPEKAEVFYNTHVVDGRIAGRRRVAWVSTGM